MRSPGGAGAPSPVAVAQQEPGDHERDHSDSERARSAPPGGGTLGEAGRSAALNAPTLQPGTRTEGGRAASTRSPGPHPRGQHQPEDGIGHTDGNRRLQRQLETAAGHLSAALGQPLEVGEREPGRRAEQRGE